MKIFFILVNKGRHVSYGAGFVASSIIEAGHELKFVDTHYESRNDVIHQLNQYQPDIVFISSMSMDYPLTIELSKEIKQQNSKLSILLGGIHATIMKEKILEENPYIDYICVGEGESASVEFIQFFGSSKIFDVSNIGYRKNSQIIINKVRKPEDLNYLPRFRWELFKKSSIINKRGGVYIHTSRGCPYSCSYCCNQIYTDIYSVKKYIRYRSADDVIEECKFLMDYVDVKYFYIQDEMFLFKEHNVIDFCERYSNEIKIPFGCMGRVEYVNDNVIRYLKKAGCIKMSMGVECGDEYFRRTHLNRKMTNQQIQNAFILVKSYGIRTVAFNMIGYPMETSATTKATYCLNKQIRPDEVQVTVFFPFKGTQLYDYCIEHGFINIEKYKKQSNYFSESVIDGKRLMRKAYQMMFYFNISKIFSYCVYFLPKFFIPNLYLLFVVLKNRVKRFV